MGKTAILAVERASAFGYRHNLVYFGRLRVVMVQRLIYGFAAEPADILFPYDTGSNLVAECSVGSPWVVSHRA
jgi:hypothetical protein